MKQENRKMKSCNSSWPSNRMMGYAVKNCLAIALALAAITTVGAAPALAASDQDQDAVHAKRLHMYAPGALDRNQTKTARDAAVQECSNEAAKLSSSSWQTAQFAAYGTCMTEHGQQP
jgi:hypothetical protein